MIGDRIGGMKVNRANGWRTASPDAIPHVTVRPSPSAVPNAEFDSPNIGVASVVGPLPCGRLPPEPERVVPARNPRSSGITSRLKSFPPREGFLSPSGPHNPDEPGGERPAK